MAGGLTESVNALYLMVDFEWGLECLYDGDPLNDPCVEVATNRVGFIRANTDVSITVAGQSRLYQCVPEMDFEMIDALKGGTADEPFRLLMPLHIFPVNAMVGNPFPTTRVSVYQCRLGDAGVPGTWGGANFSRRLLAQGQIGRTTARYNKRPDIVGIECYRNKSQMQSVTLGVTTSQRCYWRFGDSKCQYPIQDATVSPVTCTSVTNSTIRVTIPANATIGTGLQGMGAFQAFQFGYAESEGLKIFIREHRKKSGANYVVASGPVSAGQELELLLTFQPPLHPNYTWVGRSLTLVGGCTKNKAACIGKWNNAERFGGFGILVPTYNPVWEVGGGLPA
jgi:hypothetical protein